MTESKKQDCPVMITEADAYLFAHVHIMKSMRKWVHMRQK